jgi:glutamate dehydrogenase/leucine dehydrogenase
MAGVIDIADRETNLFEAMMSRFDIAARKLHLDDGLYQFLRYPRREVTVYIPVFEVLAFSQAHGVNMRTAAYMLAIDRVARGTRIRGIYA